MAENKTEILLWRTEIPYFTKKLEEKYRLEYDESLQGLRFVPDETDEDEEMGECALCGETKPKSELTPSVLTPGSFLCTKSCKPDVREMNHGIITKEETNGR